MTRPLIFFVFFISGAASLIYEVVWMRDLMLIIGATTYAVCAIISIFMGGLALGSVIFGKWADRLMRPLLVYALIEACIGLYAIIVPDLFEALRDPYIYLYRQDFTHGVLMTFRVTLVSLVLLPPTILMGGTLPVLAAFLIRAFGNIGRQTSLLYFVNTGGAVAGCLISGFLLIEKLGLFGATMVAVGLNALLAIIAVGMHLAGGSSKAVRTQAEPVVTQWSEASPALARLAIICIGFSGFTSLAYEVFWTRSLLRYISNSTYAFTTVLAIFLGGLAIGSLIYTKLPYRRSKPFMVFGLLELAVGFGFLMSVTLFPDLRSAGDFFVGGTISSFSDSVFTVVIRTGLILLLPAIFLGATLPLVTTICARYLNEVGRTIGAVYAVNTIGAICGSIAITFILIPLIGMQGSLVLLIGMNFAIGAVLIAADLETRRIQAAVLVGLTIICIVGLFSMPNDIFRRTFLRYYAGQKLVFYMEGATDTVGVVEFQNGQREIQYEDLRGTAGTHTVAWNFVLGHLPFLLHPGEPRTALNICFGVGNSLSAMAVHENLEKIDNVELSPQVLKAAGYFWTNNDVINHPKINYIIDDGRNFAMAAEETYDIIELEPPMTYTAGVINLYTREFYEDLSARLNDDGVLLQWIPVGQGTLEEEKMLFRAFHEAFPHATAWRQLSTGMAMLLIGTKMPLTIDYQLLKEKMARPQVHRDLELSGVTDAIDVLSMFTFDSQAFGEFVRDASPVQDDKTVLDFSLARHPGSGFGMGFGLSEQGDQQILTSMEERAVWYDEHRRPVVPYLRNLGDEDPDKIALMVRSRVTITATQALDLAVPESEWDR